MRIELGYPDRAAERALLEGMERRDMIAGLAPCLSPAELIALQHAVRTVHAAPALVDYIQALVDYTRRTPEFLNGLSPRAALALLNCSRAWALIDGRDRVLPEDVQAVLPGVATHRLHPAHQGGGPRSHSEIAQTLIEAVSIP
jgi:MoxR-like ATPase